MDYQLELINYLNKDTYSKETVEEIVSSLGIGPLEFKDFMKAFNELEEKGTIYITPKNYIHLASRVNIFKGKIIKVKKYNADCELINGKVVTIEHEHLLNAYQNDIVLVRFDENDSAIVLKVISHSLWEIVATYSHNNFFVDDKNFIYDIEVKLNKKFHLVNGSVVLLKVIKYNGYTLICEISKIIGHSNDIGMDVLKNVIASGVKYQFDDKLLEYTDNLISESEKSLELELAKRKDLTNKLIVTIDGLDAKDLDDAISIAINDNGNYELGVHIADVSYFVKKDSLLDKEAFTRGCSIYLADRVIPMLPHSLCNGICSLNENEIRLTMSCIMEIDNEGEVIHYDIFPSFIKSNKRLDYDDVNALFNKETTRLEYSKELKEMLFLGKRLSNLIRKKMVERGYLSLNIDEAKINIDEKTGEVIDITKRVSLEAEQMIENFMILANVTVASHIYYSELPFIYRVHPEIPLEKLNALKDNLNNINVKLETRQNYFSSKQIQDVLNKLKDSPYEDLANNLILRAMSKAYYSIENIGHFGLGEKCYTHFTSPIRRYPDLVVHRFLKKYFVENDFSDETNFLVAASENSSVCERKAIQLERDVDDIKKASFMAKFVGQKFEGIVTGVMNFGAFIKLDNTCEGLMRYKKVYEYDDYGYDYENYYYIDDFKLGDKVIVKVNSCNISQGEINFDYIKKIKGGGRNDKTNK